MDIKAATKSFGKKFSSGASAEKNAENLMEITIQGDVMHELGEYCHELYDVWYLLLISFVDTFRMYVCCRW